MIDLSLILHLSQVRNRWFSFRLLRLEVLMIRLITWLNFLPQISRPVTFPDILLLVVFVPFKLVFWLALFIFSGLGFQPSFFWFVY